MISPVDRAYMAAICLARAGLSLSADRAYLIESRLGPVARREGYASPEALIAALRNEADERLIWSAVEAMTIAESEFFRDRPVFERLVGEVLPAMVRAAGGAPVRVWSAACGAGQEIYSLAMLLADDPALAAKVELYASDLSERSLEKAQAGVYSQFEVQRGLPARTLVRCFEKDGEAFVLSPRIRQTVRWRRVNLMEDLSRLGRFELILCRGHLSQLTPEARAVVLGSLTASLTLAGRVVLGLKEEGGESLVALAPEIGLYAPADAIRWVA